MPTQFMRNTAAQARAILRQVANAQAQATHTLKAIDQLTVQMQAIDPAKIPAPQTKFEFGDIHLGEANTTVCRVYALWQQTVARHDEIHQLLARGMKHHHEHAMIIARENDLKRILDEAISEQFAEQIARIPDEMLAMAEPVVCEGWEIVLRQVEEPTVEVTEVTIEVVVIDGNVTGQDLSRILDHIGAKG